MEDERTEGLTSEEKEAQGAETSGATSTEQAEAVQKSAKPSKDTDEVVRLRRELDKMKRAHMSEDERRTADLAERERELAQRELELNSERNRMAALKAIKKAGLDNGGELALRLAEFVQGDNEGETEGRVKDFSALLKGFVDAKVQEHFKAAGRIPGKSGEGEAESPGVGVRAAQRYANKVRID